MSFCSSLSFSRNSMYSMHYSYYSVSLSGSMTSLFLMVWMFFTSSSINYGMFDLYLMNYYIFVVWIQPFNYWLIFNFYSLDLMIMILFYYWLIFNYDFFNLLCGFDIWIWYFYFIFVCSFDLVLVLLFFLILDSALLWFIFIFFFFFDSALFMFLIWWILYLDLWFSSFMFGFWDLDFSFIYDFGFSNYYNLVFWFIYDFGFSNYYHIYNLVFFYNLVFYYIHFFYLYSFYYLGLYYFHFFYLYSFYWMLSTVFLILFCYVIFVFWICNLDMAFLYIWFEYSFSDVIFDSALLYLDLAFFISMIVLVLLGMLSMWINDYMMENSFGFTSTEQFSMMYGMKLLMFSEWMLFFACFWGMMNFSMMINAYSMFFCFPLLSSYTFSLPFSNLLMLLFSSLPIQSASILYKLGMFMGCIEQLGQTMSCGMVFLVLQIKEFFYSYISISDCMIGSMFYFTTGLHGSHVFMGMMWLSLILMLYSFSFNYVTNYLFTWFIWPDHYSWGYIWFSFSSLMYLFILIFYKLGLYIQDWALSYMFNSISFIYLDLMNVLSIFILAFFIYLYFLLSIFILAFFILHIQDWALDLSGSIHLVVFSIFIIMHTLSFLDHCVLSDLIMGVYSISFMIWIQRLLDLMLIFNLDLVFYYFSFIIQFSFSLS